MSVRVTEMLAVSDPEGDDVLTIVQLADSSMEVRSRPNRRRIVLSPEDARDIGAYLIDSYGDSTPVVLAAAA